MGARTILARLAPAAVKTRHQHWREHRVVRRADGLVHRYRQRHDPIVRSGPFAGLRYPDDLCQLPKLLGTYELELHAAVERLIAGDPSTVVNVGAGEGYYAVGLARRLPRARVYAFDIDPDARRQCRALAELNRVGDRLVVGAECSATTLAGIDGAGVALVMDCEGCEVQLLSPDEIAPLRRWPILVELHDFLDPATSQTIVDRFAATHDVELIDARPRRSEDIAELAFLRPRQRDAAVDEARPPGMRWASLRPRGAPQQ